MINFVSLCIDLYLMEKLQNSQFGIEYKEVAYYYIRTVTSNRKTCLKLVDKNNKLECKYICEEDIIE